VIVSQYDMNALDHAGMLKMDFLGLTTLTVIHDALVSIKQRTGETLDLDAVPFDDEKVYQMLRAGRTTGVFQFESPLATDMLRSMRCDRFDDLVASNALMRPGPLDAGMHRVYQRRKRGEEPVVYALPELETILQPTYGVITYQEQVMRIAQVLAGISLAEADVLRKAVGKKDAELIKIELGKFVEKAVGRGYDRRIIEELAGQIETFGRYGFNKSHSVAYSVISYQTAWLKAHYPAEFMAALLSSSIGDTDSVVKFINEAREVGIDVLPPDVNESGYKFTVIGEKRIRFGLGAIRNVGKSAIDSMLAAKNERPRRSSRRARSTTWADTARSIGRCSTVRCRKRRSSSRKRRWDSSRCSAALMAGRRCKRRACCRTWPSSKNRSDSHARKRSSASISPGIRLSRSVSSASSSRRTPSRSSESGRTSRSHSASWSRPSRNKLVNGRERSSRG
jgi:DNA polymerase-3 subunit alpha